MVRQSRQFDFLFIASDLPPNAVPALLIVLLVVLIVNPKPKDPGNNPKPNVSFQDAKSAAAVDYNTEDDY